MARPRTGLRVGLTLAVALACGLGLCGGTSLGPHPPRGGPLGPVVGSPAPGATGGGAEGGSGAGVVGAGSAPGPGRPGAAQVIRALQHDRSPALSSIKPRPPTRGEEDPDAEEPLPLPGREGAVAPAPRRDSVLQATLAQDAPPSPLANFEGIANVNGALPPDTNGDIGPSDYVQWVNVSFAIYDRSGTLLYGPANGNTLWSGIGGACDTANNGDPIVQYDALADRWLMSQFAWTSTSGPFFQCLAVSTTGDPTGSWYRYVFQISATKLNDYPHFGVWPDGYYMSMNQFIGNTYAGAGAVVFDRASMLAGDPDASGIYFDLQGVDPNLGGMLPSDLDGPAPPAGAPNVYAEADDNGNGYAQDQVDLWAFHVDWATPASSTFTHVGALATASFDSNLCAYDRNCVKQPGHPTQGLDALSDRLMYRLQYRNFGNHQTLVLNHTVDVDGTDRAGIRWYELRKSGSTWSIYQQGTYSPDTTGRWLASAGMDIHGNIALGYSASSATVYPSIRYTGRLAGDTLGQMTLGEGTIIDGSGSQTHPAARWGDYAMLALDPTDDCTFWFTSEYVATTGSEPWQTRIASFRMPDCDVADSTPPAVSSFVPTTATPTRATTISYALSFAEPVTGLTAADLQVSGSATGCSVGTPTGAVDSYAVSVSGCSPGTVTLALLAGGVTDLASNDGPSSDVAAPTVTIDRTAPTTSTPAASLRTGVTYGSALAARLSWSGTDTGGAGVSSYDVARSLDGGSFSVIATGLTSPALNVSVASQTYRYEIRAHDKAGNVGAWKAGSTMRRLVSQDTSSAIHYGSGWHSATSASYSGGSVHYAGTAGASLSYTFTGRAIAFVTTRSPARGQVKVYFDSALVATLDLGNPTWLYRQVVWSKSWSSSGSHTVKLVVVGTAGRARVDLDAFLVLR